MRKVIYKIKIGFLFTLLAIGFFLGGCTKYLDQAPEASISEKDVFSTFNSFQGYVEYIYNAIPDPMVFFNGKGGHFNLADEVYVAQPRMVTNFDIGNYWFWTTDQSFLGGRPLSLSTTDPTAKVLWPNAWYAISKANLGLANLDLLANATQEEKDIIKGQLLYLRGYFYLDMMRYWGGLPYIDRVLSATEELKFPRLNYRETALKAAGDLQEAANLLPLKWDDTATGKRTFGNNRQRFNKIMALSFLGKDLLYAASPLMNRESTGNATYDTDLCKKAAEVLSTVINLCDQTGIYSLQPWTSYSDIFYTVGANSIVPGGSEVIMTTPIYSGGLWNYSINEQLSRISNTAIGTFPTANYVKNWGMANGLPITDPASGYNPADPWSNRDPRFYKTIVVDGDKLCNTTVAGVNQFAQLYTNGIHRLGIGGSGTGYVSKKYYSITQNKYDNNWKFWFFTPLMRLSDVYLMYAEAVLQGYGTAQSSFPGGITAEAAFNRVRNRATLPNIDAKFTATKAAFMDEIIRERAVELSFEGHRFTDLRRWLLAKDDKYVNKTAIYFDRGPNGKPINMNEQVIVKRVVEEKHYWLPLPLDQVTLYAGFGQNPGW